MEPPSALVSGWRTPNLTAALAVPDWLRVAAWAAATALVVGLEGDVLLLALVLAALAADGAGVGVVLALLVAALRSGTVAVDGIAGAHAVLGPLAAVAPASGAAATCLGAAALLVASPGGLAAVPFGLAAALVAAWPGAVTPASVATRVIAAVAAIALAAIVPRAVSRRKAVPLSIGLGAAALALGVLA